MMTVHYPYVAGIFYPQEKDELRGVVQYMLAEAEHISSPPLKSCTSVPLLLVPHAGYVYSGQVAANGYRLIKTTKNIIKRVVIFGPAHRVALKGCAAINEQFVRTPLGDIPVDLALAEKLCRLKQFTRDSSAHVNEHSLEVQLPFLQELLSDFTVLPVVVGDISPAQMCEVFAALPKEDDLLVIISTDLSHFNRYDDAVLLDNQTMNDLSSARIVKSSQACGAMIVNGLAGEQGFLHQRGLKLSIVSYANSGDITSLKDSVVGYVSCYAS